MPVYGFSLVSDALMLFHSCSLYDDPVSKMAAPLQELTVRGMTDVVGLVLWWEVCVSSVG